MDTLEPALIEAGTLITALGADAWLWVGNFLALIVLTLILFFFAMHQGASGLISLNIALYAGYALYIVFPYTDAVVGIGSAPLIQAIISIGLFILLMIVPFMISLRLTAPSFGQLSIIQNFLLSLGAAVFLMALAYHVFQISDIYAFSEPLNYLFESKGYFFYWFIAPLVGLWFLAR